MNAKQNPSPPRSIAVLLVEDDPIQAQAARRLLEQQINGALDLHHADRLAAALDRLALQPPPQAVVLDLDLPDSRGLDTVERVLDTAPHLPVLVVTGNDDPNLRRQALARGAQDYLVKGTPAAQRLGEVVLHALTHQPASGALAAVRAEHRRLRRLIRAVREINRLIIQIEAPQPLLERTCAILAETRGYRCVLACLLEADGKTLRRAAVAGPVNLAAPCRDCDGVSARDCPLAVALAERRPVICHNAAECPHYAAWLSADNADGFRSVAIFPLQHGHRLFGALTVCAESIGAFDDAETGLLEEVARDLGLALHAHESEQTRATQDAELHLLRAALEASNNAVVLTDARGDIRWTNPAFTALTGYDAKEVLGQNPRFLKSGQQDEAFYRQLWTTITGGQPWRSEIINRRKDGTLYTEEMTITPVRGKRGTIEHFIAIKQDVTARHHAEERLRQQARLLELATDAIMVVGLEGRLRFWNPACERLAGGPPAGPDGSVWQSTLLADGTLLANARHLTLTEGAWRGELELTNRQGERRTVLSRWTLVRDTRGQPEAFLVIQTDITEHKRLQAQFLRTQRMETIGCLASGIAHDLNNILAPILLCASMLRPQTSEAERARMLGIIETSTRRAVEVVRQLLSFGRGRESRKDPVQPRHLVAELAKILQETFPRNLRIECACPRDLWPVVADVTQLHQVLMNLCVNARDAMPGGGTLLLHAENVTVDAAFVSQHPEAQTGPHVRFRVADTGTGIAPEILPRIFDPFFTTKTAGRGSGLGLTTVLGIVKDHGGFVVLDSRPGCGTTFDCFLPAMPGTAPTVAPGTLADAAKETPLGRGESVLLVEDEPSIRLALEQILRLGGYRVYAAADGVEALKHFISAPVPVNVLVTDLFMPHLDGALLCRAVRRPNPNLPIIVTTGAGPGPALAAQQRMLEELGITHILQKPHTSEELLLRLHQLLTPPREP
ncbi:MAG: response regulator [Limisphaerales bacterium]